jgi:hypothetical protein
VSSNYVVQHRRIAAFRQLDSGGANAPAVSSGILAGDEVSEVIIMGYHLLRGCGGAFAADPSEHHVVGDMSAAYWKKAINDANFRELCALEGDVLLRPYRRVTIPVIRRLTTSNART